MSVVFLRSGTRLSIGLRNLIFGLGIVLSAVLFSSCRTKTNSRFSKDRTHHEQKVEPAPFVLIIYYDGAVGSADLLRAVRDYKSKLVYEYKNFNGIAIALDPKRHDHKEAIKHFEGLPGVLSVMLDRKVELHIDTL